MKKQIKTLFIAAALLASSAAIADTPIINYGGVTKIDMTCQKIENSKGIPGFHRTPVQVPNVYLLQETGTLFFENTCYECTLELVIPETDTAVYTSSIEDGAETFQIPNGFTGTYELHIHHGNYCFYGEIEL